MLDQVIYTRCMPCRDILNKGVVMRNDGYGVFSMSSQLFENASRDEIQLINSRLPGPNASKEDAPAGLFSSYEYAPISENGSLMIFEVVRPHCKTPRKNGRSHRAGTFIKQALFGGIKGYPFEWFGADTWDAYKKEENDYYLDEDPSAAPEFLPQVSPDPKNGYITLQKVKEFVDDGRTEAVKAGLWFLLSEYSKPETERKVLLIKDTAANVELWIAAMEYGLSAELAAMIPFSTNKTKLGTQTDNVLFYKADEQGRIVPITSTAPTVKRHPYCMIVGYHPEDKFSTVRQMPNSNFVILDGTAKKAEFTVGDDINSAYYTAFVKYGEDITDFCGRILPCISQKEISSDIPELYDAYKYVLAPDHKAEKWSYDVLIKHLTVLAGFGITQNTEQSGQILNEIMQVYDKFMPDDENNGYKLLKTASDSAAVLGRSGEVTGCLADCLSGQLGDLSRSGKKLADTWDKIKSSDIKQLTADALRLLFNDTELSIYAKQFVKTDSKTIETVMDMFFAMIKADEGVESIRRSGDKYRFVCYGLSRLIDDTAALGRVFGVLDSSDELINSLALSVSEQIEKQSAGKSIKWWEFLLDNVGTDINTLCKNLCSAEGANIELVEQLLSKCIYKKRKCDSEIISSFLYSMDKLGKNDDTGVLFCKKWADVANASALPEIIRTAARFRLMPGAEKEIFENIESLLPYSPADGAGSAVYAEMKTWGERIGMVSSKSCLYDFKRVFVREKRPDALSDKALEFISKNIAVGMDYVVSRDCAEIAAAAAGSYSEDIYLLAMCLFDIDGAVLNKYIEIFVNTALANAKGHNLAKCLLSLMGAASNSYAVDDRTDAFVKKVQRTAESCLAQSISGIRKFGLEDAIEKTPYDEGVKEKLTALIGEQNGGIQNSIGKAISGIKSLFGKK